MKINDLNCGEKCYAVNWGPLIRQYASVPANTGLGRIGEFWGFARKQRGSDEGRQEAKLKFTCKLCLYIYNHITQNNK